MMPKARQTPTQQYVLPYSKSKGREAVKLYNTTKRKAIKWQSDLLKSIMATDKDGLWIHQKFGYSVPRRNGKNEIVSMRELWGLLHGEQICHSAHKQSTSSAAYRRLCAILKEAGYEEVIRIPKDETQLPEKWYHPTNQYGLESISLGDGRAVFRTRTPNGGLGEGFDLLVIDEAQEYTEEQETALIYTVSDSKNPQTIFCGTPPTMTSAGTVFTNMRDQTLEGKSYDTGWAEWGVLEEPKDITDVSLWYETNPSIGHHLDERKIRSEIRKDTLDFIIQRLGYWFKYSLKSAISKAEWDALQVKELPELSGKLSVGIKYNKDNTNVSMSIAVRTWDGKIFVEAIGCHPISAGNTWILAFLRQADVEKVTVDGKNGQEKLMNEMKDIGLKKPELPTVAQVIAANALFTQALADGQICHMGQPSLMQSVTNCEQRAIGSNGGFGYRSLREDVDITLLDSVIFAVYNCSKSKAKKKQVISY